MKQNSKLIIELVLRNVTTMKATQHLGILALHRKLTDLRLRGFEIGSSWMQNILTNTRYKKYWIAYSRQTDECKNIIDELIGGLE